MDRNHIVILNDETVIMKKCNSKKFSSRVLGEGMRDGSPSRGEGGIFKETPSYLINIKGQWTSDIWCV